MPAMSEAEVLGLLEQANVAVAFDTNAIFGGKLRVLDLINQANEIRRGRFSLPPIKKVIAAPVWMEKLHHMNRFYGPTFEINMPLGVLRAKEVEIVAFDDRHAMHTAKRLAQMFPDEGAWLRAKRERCAKSLNVVVPEGLSKNKKCDATIDWLIAGLADADELLLVTDDGDDAYKDLPRQTTLRTMEKSVEALLKLYTSRNGIG